MALLLDDIGIMFDPIVDWLLKWTYSHFLLLIICHKH
jgi:hypothetical protein